MSAGRSASTRSAALVILNNPDLKAAQGETRVAEAKLLQASIAAQPSRPASGTGR